MRKKKPVSWIRTTYCFTSNGRPTLKIPISIDSSQKLKAKKDRTIELYIDDELGWKKSIDEYLDCKMWGIHNDTFAISSAHLDGPESVYILIE